MKKKILFLEDNLDTIASLVDKLEENEKYDITLTKSLKAWKSILNEWGSKNIPSLFIIDDNIYGTFSLADIGKADILTNGGDIAGTTLINHIRNANKEDFCFTYKDIPIITYSVHDKNFCEKHLDTLEKTYVFQKHFSDKFIESVVKKCKEILE